MHYISEQSFLNEVDSLDLEDLPDTLIQIFTSKADIGFIEDILHAISTRFKKSVIIGATTDGEILNKKVYTQTTVVSISNFEKTTLGLSYENYENYELVNFREIGANLLKSNATKNTKVAIVFADGMSTNGEELLKGFEEFNPNIVISGGLAGDNAEFKNTFVFCNGAVLEYGAVCVTLNSEVLNIKTDYSFNYSPIGKKLTVTKSDKNRVYEIDGVNAVEIYKKYLGKSVEQHLPGIGIEFPLILNRYGINIARAIINKNEDGSLTFAGNIDEGESVRFGYGDIDAILQKSILDTQKYALTQSTFIYSCMARRRLLDDCISNEISPLFELTKSLAGFFTYGEFFSSNCKNELLNQTMTILRLSEEEIGDNIQHSGVIKEIDKPNRTISSLVHLLQVTSHELDLDILMLEEQSLQIAKQKRKEGNIETISALSHQWRQPLNVLSLIISKLKFYKDMKMPIENKIDKFLADAEETVDTLSDLLEDLKQLFLNRTNRDIEIDIEGLLLGALIEPNKLFKTANIEHKIEYNIDPGVKIFIDIDKVSKILNTLYLNAIEALMDLEGQKPLLETKVDLINNHLVFEISNNGNEIPVEVGKKIFDPYFSTKSDNERGLGLYIAKILTQDHMNGEIWYESNESFTKFSVSFETSKGKN